MREKIVTMIWVEVEAFDNQGATFDQYTVIVHDPNPFIATMSYNPGSPQGVCHVELYNPAHHLKHGTPVGFDQLPESMQDKVRALIVLNNTEV